LAVKEKPLFAACISSDVCLSAARTAVRESADCIADEVLGGCQVHKFCLDKKLCDFGLVGKMENLKNLSKLSRQYTVVRRRQRAERRFLPYFWDDKDGAGAL